MREIKFRIYWAGKMRYSENGDFVIYRGEPRLNEYGDMIGLGGKCSPLMQYTGLKDKNSKEIYEGDIVKLCDTNPVLFKVEIVLGRYGYKTIFRYLDDNTIAEHYFLDKCEIVGNIYENPELLKEKATGTQPGD